MKSKLIVSAAFALLLWGCSKGNDTPEQTSELSLLNVSLDGSVLSQGSAVGVFLAGDNGYTPLNNVKYSFDKNWSSENPVELGTAVPTICVYYPYDPSLMDGTAVPLASQQYSPGADFCYGFINSSTRSTTPLSFSLNHAYAQMTLSITRDAAYRGPCAISGVSLSNVGLNAFTRLNLFTGVYHSATGVVAFNPQISGVEAGQSARVVALLVPVSTAMSGNLVITLTVDGVPLSTNVDVVQNSLSTLEAGKNYQGTLSVQPADTQVNTVTIKGWGVNAIAELPLVPSGNDN